MMITSFSLQHVDDDGDYVFQPIQHVHDVHDVDDYVFQPTARS